jgi:hypothetical protein
LTQYEGLKKADKVPTAASPREVVVAADSVALLVYNKDTNKLLTSDSS